MHAASVHIKILDSCAELSYNFGMLIGIDLRLPTYQMGGISQYALHLLPALAALEQSADHEFFIYHSRKEKRTFLPEASGRFRRRNIWTPCHHRLERWLLGSEMLPDGLDLLHSPDFIPPAWGTKRRVITIHDLNFVYYPQFLTAESRRYYLDQIQWAADTADHISVDSHATRADVMRILGISEHKVTTVHLAANAVYSAAYTSAAVAATLQKYDLRPGFILFVGTLEPRKNLPMLLKAYDRLRREKGLEAPLVLVGAIGWEAQGIFETISSLDLEGSVRHIQGVVDVELAHFYHSAGVLVTPSFYEGFGLPALEAQHCGCPAVVSNRGSLPEIVGEQGLMLDPDDDKLWAETIYCVLNDLALREQMIRAGKDQAATFSWEATAIKTMEIYENCYP